MTFSYVMPILFSLTEMCLEDMIETLENTKEVQLPGPTSFPRPLESNRWSLDLNSKLIVTLAKPARPFEISVITTSEQLDDVMFKITYKTTTGSEQEKVLNEGVSKGVCYFNRYNSYRRGNIAK